LRQSAQKNALVWAKAPASIIVSDGAKLPRSLEVIIDPGRWIVAIVYQRHGADNLPIGAGFCSAKRNVVNKGMRAIARAIDKDYAVSKLSSNNEVINEKPDVELLALMKSWERQ
jgi:hypothetical protein